MLNIREHEDFSANKYQTANYFGIFIFITRLSWAEHDKRLITSGRGFVKFVKSCYYYRRGPDTLSGGSLSTLKGSILNGKNLLPFSEGAWHWEMQTWSHIICPLVKNGRSWTKCTKSPMHYRIRPNYRTYPNKRAVKQFRSLQITARVLFVYFTVKAYVMGAHLNCIDLLRCSSNENSQNYACIKKIRENLKISHKHNLVSLSLIFFLVYP